MKRFNREGFTTVELLLFSAIFALVSIAFLSILVAVVRVQTRQGAANEVNQQTEFVMSTIQSLVERSSYIETTTNPEQVTLRMPDPDEDPTLIFLEDARVAIEVNGQAEYLTTPAVEVSGLRFVKQTNAKGKDVLYMSMTMGNNLSNPQRAFARALDIVVSRVSAATFDSDLVPNADSSWNLGVNAQKWDSVNELIYFTSSNVGIGATTPSQKLEVDGGLRLNTGTSRPSCDSSARGTVWLTQNSGGTPDNFAICMKYTTSSYTWADLEVSW